MSHGSPPLPKRGLEIVEGVPPPVGAPPGIPPDYDDDSGFEPFPFLTRAEEARAGALQAAATLLGPLVASAVSVGRPAPVSREEMDRVVKVAERAWLDLAARAEAWITGGGS